MKLSSKISVLFSTLVVLAASCQTLDIPPKNILSGSDIYTEAGIEAYMAGMYNHIPMEDFKYQADNSSYGGFYYWYMSPSTLGNTGEFYNAECGNTIKYGDKGYWKDAYQLIRNANVLIQDLPNFYGKLAGAEEWCAEARFIRAYTMFALVKRYGGVPIMDHPQAPDEDLLVGRSSHQDCVDFIIEDLDYAIENMTAVKTRGRGNKYVAATLLARVALYAGSIARYGADFMFTGESGTVLCGIPASLANTYFRKAYDACKIVEQGGYSLLNGADKRQAFYNVFQQAVSSPESIFIREYDLNNYAHSWNTVMAPELWTGTYGNRYFVPWDWCELFDGIPIDPATGYAKFTDEDGNYIVYDSCSGIYDNAEPRLKASILIPGEKMFAGKTLDLRCGLLVNGVTPDQKIKKTTKDDGKTTYSWDNGVKEFKVDGQVVAVRSNQNPKNGQPYENTGVAICGLNGPATSGGNTCLTGVYGAKWYDLDAALPGQLQKDTHPWIDMRYAEVLLMRAEAAVEMAQDGASDAAALYNDAFNCINAVRERGGANLLTSPDELADMTALPQQHGTGKYQMVFAPNKGIQIVRVERYKELAVEHKLYWDLRRWFTGHTQMRQYRFRMVAPYLFLSTATVDPDTGIPSGKYIFDTRVCDSYGGEHNWDSKYYYERIPESERSINYKLEQNARY